MTENTHPHDNRRRPQRANGVVRYQQLLDAAERLLIRDGSAAMTIQALAQEASVPVGSVYHYFPNPVAVSLALSERYMAGFHEIFDQPIEGLEVMTWQEVATILISRGISFYRNHPYAQTLVLGSDHGWHIRKADVENNRALAAGIAKLLTGKTPPMPPGELDDAVFVAIGINDSLLSLSIAEHGSITDRFGQEAVIAVCAYLERKFQLSQTTTP